MARKKVSADDSIPVPVPQYNTAASIESGLADFLAQISSSCGGVFTLTYARDAEQKAKAALNALSKKKKKASCEQTGLIATTTNQVTGQAETVPVTVEVLESWVTKYSQLAANFQSVNVLLQSLVKLGTKNTQILNERSIYRADVMTAATMSLHSSGKYTFESLPLCTRYRTLCITEPDREFLYKNLRKNGSGGKEIIYWISDEGAIAIPKDEKTGNILQGDSEFWTAFYNANDQNICDILHGIEKAAYDYEKLRPVGENGMPEQSFEDLLLQFVPQCMIRNAFLTKRFSVERGADGKDVTRFDCFLIECGSGLEKSAKREQWQTVLAKTLLSGLSTKEIKYAPQFSNTPGVGLRCIPLAGEYENGTSWSVDKLGMQGRLAAERGEKAPELPSELKKYFYGVNGDLCLFQSDPEMCLLRIADFIYRVLVEGTYCRQCLVLAGSAKDGKSILVKIIYAILGLEIKPLSSTKGIEDPQYLYPVMNEPLVVFPEVQKPQIVFDSSPFKAVTGGDSLQVKKLYCTPVTWHPEHTRFMMTTNKQVFLKGEAPASRCLPIACQKAYTGRTVRTEEDIIASCLLQRVEILQWVCDTVAYYKAVKTVNGESTGIFMPDRLLIVTDEDYKKVIEGEIQLLDMSERDKRKLERHAIEATGVGLFHVNYNDEGSEDETEWYEILYDALFEPDQNGIVKRSCFTKALLEGITPDPYTKIIPSKDAKLAADALGIKHDHILWDKSFKAFKDWMLAEGKMSIVKIKGDYYCKGIKLKQLGLESTVDVEDM